MKESQRKASIKARSVLEAFVNPLCPTFLILTCMFCAHIATRISTDAQTADSWIMRHWLRWDRLGSFEICMVKAVMFQDFVQR